MNGEDQQRTDAVHGVAKELDNDLGGPSDVDFVLAVADLHLASSPSYPPVTKNKKCVWIGKNSFLPPNRLFSAAIESVIT